MLDALALEVPENPADHRGIGQEGEDPHHLPARTEAPSRAGEGKQELASAGVAVHSGEAPAQVAAIREGVDHSIDESAPATVPRLEALLPGALDLS